VLLVAQGITCLEVCRLLGDAPRSVEYWVRRFEAQGLAGLSEGQRSGRPRRLSEAQLQEVDQALRQTPRDLGLRGTLWDGKTLSAWIERPSGFTWRCASVSGCSGSGAFGCANPAP
jgi:transposase